MALTKSEQLKKIIQSAIDLNNAGKLSDATDLLEDSARRFDQSAALWGYLGFLYGENGSDAKAIRALRKATALSPHSELASLGLFHSLWRAGKTDAAFKEMRRFVKGYESPQYRRMLREMLVDAPGEQSNAGHALVTA